MKSTLEYVAGRLVLVAASGLPLLTTTVAVAQNTPAASTRPAAAQPASTEVQRQLDALYQKNGMQAPSLSADARQREVEARTQLREQREALARRQAAAQQPTAGPAAARESSPAVPASTVQPVPPIDFQPTFPDTSSSTHQRSTTLKPSARHSHRYTGSNDTTPAPVADRQYETSNENGPTVTPQRVAATPQPRAPRRGFVLFGRGDDGERGSFLGRLFGRDSRQPREELVPPNPNIGIAPKPEFPAESIANEQGDPADRPVVAPRVTTPTPNSAGPAASRVAKAPIIAPAPGAESESTVATDSVKSSKPIPSTQPTQGPRPDAPGFELPVAKSGDAGVRPIPDDIGTPFPEGSEQKADADAPVADIEPSTATKPPVIEPKPAAPKSVEPLKVAAGPEPTSPPEAEVDPRMQRIAERSGETGLKGFCPVALRDDRRLVDTDDTWAIVHKGRTYHLGSEAALHKFESDPEKYAPVASGHDVILLTVEGRRVEGSLDHAVWYKDRLHLFSSQETLGRFVRSLKTAPFAESGTRQASGTIALPEPKAEAKPSVAPASPDWTPSAGRPEPKKTLPAPTAKPIPTTEPSSTSADTPTTDETPESAVRPEVELGDEADSFDGEASPFEEDFANPFEDEDK